MSEPTTYGCYAEIEAAAIFFDTPIVVYEFLSTGQYKEAAIAHRDGRMRPVYLLFTVERIHYSFLEPDFDDW